MPKSNPYSDPSCEKIAAYLFAHLNESYPEQTIVRSVRHFDAFNIPALDYPVLKVYRLNQSGKLKQNTSRVSAVISYGLILPDLDALAPILGWVCEQIVFWLNAYQLACSDSPTLAEDYNAEYRTMLNELTNRVHMFLRVNFSFTEN